MAKQILNSWQQVRCQLLLKNNKGDQIFCTKIIEFGNGKEKNNKFRINPPEPE